MSEVTLICRSCQAVLTKSLEVANTAENVADAFCPERNNQFSVVNKGYVLYLTEDVRQAINRTYGWSLVTPDVWITPEDLTEEVALVEGYSTQCCGPDGFRGPNRQCSCGALIGTEESECFQEGIVRPDAAVTYWQKTDVLAKIGRAS